MRSFLRSKRNQNIDDQKQDEIEPRIFCISQNVIIKSVCEKSLLNPSIKAQLPKNLDNIYQSMMSDLSFINNHQYTKDYGYYQCNMTFWKGEETVSSKRTEVVDLSAKIEKQNRKSRKRKIVSHAKTKDVNKDSEEKDVEVRKSKSRKVENLTKTKKDLTIDVTKIAENNTPGKEDTLKPSRKRKMPSKFRKSEEVVSVNGNTEKNPVIDNSLIIDLSGDDAISPKTKIYFREPPVRNLVNSNGKKLKEHTLLDKILLGVQCVRHWTERGLHLTKLAEGDLFLVNKRLASVRCTLSDLEEHTDENNNKSLSVLIQSDMFAGLAPSVPQKTTEVVDVRPPNSSPTPDNNNVPAPISRHKSKQHVSAMYRQRHNLPSILTKPTLTGTPQKLLTSADAIMPQFSAVKTEDVTSPQSQSLVATDSAPLPSSDPSMSASRLLKLKSQRSTTAAQQQPESSMIDLTKQSVLQPTQLQHVLTTVNGFSAHQRPPMFFSTNHGNNFIMPIYVSPQRTVVQLPQRPFRIPLCQVVATDSVRLSNQLISGQYHRQPQIPQVNIPTLTSRTDPVCLQPVNGARPSILKNLLQQSNQITNGRPFIPANHMMPLSAFQNNKNNKWPVGPISDLQLKK